MALTEQPSTDRGIDVRIATTDAEREAVYRFRYEVYVEELGRYRAIADHEHRRLADPEDDHSWIVYATADDAVVGSFRVTWGGDGFSARQVDQYQLEPFLAELPAERMAVGERTMISPRWRGGDLFSTLGEGSASLTASHDVRVVFGACEPHLISFYARYQRPYGRRNINSPEAGFLVPLVSFPQGPEALREFGAPGELPPCVSGVLDGTGTVLSPLLAGDENYERRVRGSIDSLESSVFDGLDHEAVMRVIRRSNVVTCRAGDRLLKRGGSARNVFVVLDGALVVSRDGVLVGSVGPGEIVGEMANLLRQPRSFDVDVVENTHVLSLSERTLAALADGAPAAAARLASNIARQLSGRLTNVGAHGR
jgi:hypothetical protein